MISHPNCRCTLVPLPLEYQRFPMLQPLIFNRTLSGEEVQRLYNADPDLIKEGTCDQKEEVQDHEEGNTPLSP